MIQTNKPKGTPYNKEIKQELNNFDIITEKSSKDIYNKNKTIFWDMLKPYNYIVWYYWGTKWRTNQDVIKTIKDNFDVKNIQN